MLFLMSFFLYKLPGFSTEEASGQDFLVCILSISAAASLRLVALVPLLPDGFLLLKRLLKKLASTVSPFGLESAYHQIKMTEAVELMTLYQVHLTVLPSAVLAVLEERGAGDLESLAAAPCGCECVCLHVQCKFPCRCTHLSQL